MTKKYLYIWKIDTFQIDTNEQQSISHNLKLINFSGILFGLWLSWNRLYTLPAP